MISILLFYVSVIAICIIIFKINMYQMYLEQMWHWLVWENLLDLFGIIRKNKNQSKKLFFSSTQILGIKSKKGLYICKSLAYNTWFCLKFEQYKVWFFQSQCISSHVGLFYVQGLSHSSVAIFHMNLRYKNKKTLCSSFKSFLLLDLTELYLAHSGCSIYVWWIEYFDIISSVPMVDSTFFLKNNE